MPRAIECLASMSLYEVTVTNDICKHYSMEVTNDTPKSFDTTYVCIGRNIDPD